MAASYFKRLVTRRPAVPPLRPVRSVFSAPAPGEAPARPVAATPLRPPPAAPAPPAPKPQAPRPATPRPERRALPPSPLIAQQLIRPEDVASRPPSKPRPATGSPERPAAPLALPSPMPVPPFPRPVVAERPGASPSSPPATARATPTTEIAAPSAARSATPDDRPIQSLAPLDAAAQRMRETSPALAAVAKTEQEPATPRVLKPPAATAGPVTADAARIPERPAARIEIGAVEVRLAQVEPRPRRAAPPVERRGRGFVYPFGFRQS